MTAENLKSKPDDVEKLGPLRGQVWLTLQTNQARRLVRGRNGTKGRSPIIGLGLFAERLRLIWQASRNDDPYADWWLIKVHEAIEDREALFELCKRLDEKNVLYWFDRDELTPEHVRDHEADLLADEHGAEYRTAAAEGSDLHRRLLRRRT